MGMRCLSQLWSRCLDAVFPPRCPFCDFVYTGPNGVCDDCKSHLRITTDPYCMKCGKQLSDETQEYCEDCKRAEHQFISGRSCFQYDGLVRHSIYRFKYAGRKEYAKVYAHYMATHFKAYVRSVSPDMLVPIPLHRRRFLRRGYNQAQLLADGLGRELGIPCRNDLIKRVKNTRPQKELDVWRRQNNLKKAFKITGNDVKCKTIILIDDIYTTGSTMDAVAEVLFAHGAKAVHFLTIAAGR